MPLLQELASRYRIFMYDAGYKGYYRAFFETVTEVMNKRRLIKMGVSHPDYSTNLTTTIAKSENKDAHENQPSSFYILKKVFKKLKLKSSDINLLDIGCGTGRVLTFGMLSKFNNVTGVDLDEEGIKQAIVNCGTMQQMGYQTGVTIYTGDACKIVIGDNINVIYLFNPFGEKTMEKVLDNILSHINEQKKSLFVIYSNPVNQHLFEKHKEVTKIHESYFKNKKPDVTIYRIDSNLRDLHYN